MYHLSFGKMDVGKVPQAHFSYWCHDLYFCFWHILNIECAADWFGPLHRILYFFAYYAYFLHIANIFLHIFGIFLHISCIFLAYILHIFCILFSSFVYSCIFFAYFFMYLAYLLYVSCLLVSKQSLFCAVIGDHLLDCKCSECLQ